RARRLGTTAGINYRRLPNWSAEVMSITDGLGADLVVAVEGPSTLTESVAAARVGGTISIVGTLPDGPADFDVRKVARKALHLRGIAVGSRTLLESLARALAHARSDRSSSACFRSRTPARRIGISRAAATSARSSSLGAVG